MRINYSTGTRENPVDRNPSIQYVNGGVTGAGAHGYTLRGALSVSAGTTFLLNHIFLMIRRITVAGTPFDLRGECRIFDGVSERIIAMVQMKTNLALDTAIIHTNPQVLVMENDEVRLYSYNGDTGGTVDYYMSFFGTRYDQ